MITTIVLFVFFTLIIGTALFVAGVEFGEKHHFDHASVEKLERWRCIIEGKINAQIIAERKQVKCKECTHLLEATGRIEELTHIKWYFCPCQEEWFRAEHRCNCGMGKEKNND